MDVTSLAELLREAEDQHGRYEPSAPKHHWADWWLYPYYWSTPFDPAASWAARGPRSAEPAVPSGGAGSDDLDLSDIGGTMTTLTGSVTTVREPSLLGQTVVVIGGSSGIGLETARSARAEGAEIVLTGRDPERLRHAAADLGAQRHAAFDAHDPDHLDAFFRSLPAPVDHVLVTAGGPYYAPLADMDMTDATRYVADHVRLTLEVARHADRTVRPGGALLLMSGTGGRRPAVGISLTALLTAGLPALTANLALELAPVRVNLIAAGFVDTPLSASLLGDDLDERRAHLRATLPIRRVVVPEDVASLAVHIMTNTALTGATFDVDGGQQVT